jgi:hypothetical protein
MNSMRYAPCVSSLSHNQSQASHAVVSLIVVLLIISSIIVGLLGS